MDAKIRGFKDLVAWQRGIDLVQEVYEVSRLLPPDERFGLTSQARRAAVSVPSNIAEGHGRRTKADFVHFLDMARGSANEVETQLLVAVRLTYLTDKQASKAVQLADEVQRIVRGLLLGLKNAQA